jgi:hypothetical protein
VGLCRVSSIGKYARALVPASSRAAILCAALRWLSARTGLRLDSARETQIKGHVKENLNLGQVS